MSKLIYTAIMSLDGYIADKDSDFSWAEPDEEVHSFINELERPVGTYLYGRRMYEVMAAWQALPTHEQPSFIADFANIWRVADKVVYSNSVVGFTGSPFSNESHRFSVHPSSAGHLPDADCCNSLSGFRVGNHLAVTVLRTTKIHDAYVFTLLPTARVSADGEVSSRRRFQLPNRLGFEMRARYAFREWRSKGD